MLSMFGTLYLGVFRLTELGRPLKLRIGYEFIYHCPRPTPMILMLNVHYSRASDLAVPDAIMTMPPMRVSGYRDLYGNWCSRIMAPVGESRITCDRIIEDSGLEDPVVSDATEHRVETLPDDVLVYLLPSRFCENDHLLQTAWSLFGALTPGWSRVQAICDFAHKHIRFSYADARPTRTALEAYQEKIGVCRDYTHLAIALCRAINIPARYCTGYLGDVGTPPPFPPGDFAAWMEVYLGGEWHMFDPRNNTPRIGRVLMARGRDAADVAMVTAFGTTDLKSFRVWTDEVIED